MNKDKLAELQRQLRLAGLKSTKPRYIILESLLNFPRNHFSSDDIHGIIPGANPHIGIATVYRTLSLFEQMGIISKLDFGDGVYRYELKRPDENHHHHHLICKHCGSISEVEEDLLDALEDQILRKYDFVVNDHELKFFGLCKNCK
jgi:Fur family transcriptional regulator, ferric uptake regulator